MTILFALISERNVRTITFYPMNSNIGLLLIDPLPPPPLGHHLSDLLPRVDRLSAPLVRACVLCVTTFNLYIMQLLLNYSSEHL